MINMFDITELYLYLLPPSVLITEHFKSLSSLFFQLNGASSTFFSSELFLCVQLIWHFSSIQLSLNSSNQKSLYSSFVSFFALNDKVLFERIFCGFIFEAKFVVWQSLRFLSTQFLQYILCISNLSAAVVDLTLFLNQTCFWDLFNREQSGQNVRFRSF